MDDTLWHSCESTENNKTSPLDTQSYFFPLGGGGGMIVAARTHTSPGMSNTKCFGFASIKGKCTIHAGKCTSPMDPIGYDDHTL